MYDVRVVCIGFDVGGGEYLDGVMWYFGCWEIVFDIEYFFEFDGWYWGDIVVFGNGFGFEFV